VCGDTFVQGNPFIEKMSTSWQKWHDSWTELPFAMLNLMRSFAISNSPCLLH